MSSRFTWTITDSAGVTSVALVGSVDEDADLGRLQTELNNHPYIRFDLSGVRRINSCGVREWVNFIRALSSGYKVELEKCNPAVVSQLNMISNFAGNASVLSVQVPFVCPACGSEADALVGVETKAVPELQPVTCAECGQTMEFDDVVDSYFAFLS